MRPRRSPPIPQLGVDRTAAAAVPADWGIYPYLFNVEDATFAFLEDVLREVIELFPGPYIHVGGDEAVKDQWRARRACRQRMRELGIADEHALQSYFMQRIGRFLAANGRRLIGWDEILEGGLRAGCDGDVVARHRRRARGGAAGSRRGASPWPDALLRQPAGHAAPASRRAAARVVDLADVYASTRAAGAHARAASAHPGPAGQPLDRARPHRGPRRLDDLSARRGGRGARLVAARSGATLPDFRRAAARRASRWYDALGLATPRTRAFGAAAALAAANAAVRSQELKLCSDKLMLTLEDDAPVRGDRAPCS